ncbi:MAG: hypothetical protein IJ715_03415 [Bacilli bacterium]|nr:hypothetical protein [Bacilli bacterium]MBR1936099.1 hypothetical protein [Bacilli bacterium]
MSKNKKEINKNDYYAYINMIEIVLLIIALVSIFIVMKDFSLFSSTTTPLEQFAMIVILISLASLALLELYSLYLTPKKSLYFNLFCLGVEGLLIYFIFFSSNFRYPELLIYVPFLLLFKYCYRIYLVR